MKIEIINKSATTKDGKNVAFAEIYLHIDGDKYPIKLCVDNNNTEYKKKDKQKLNNALKIRGFVIGEVSEIAVVPTKILTMKGEMNK